MPKIIETDLSLNLGKGDRVMLVKFRLEIFLNETGNRLAITEKLIRDSLTGDSDSTRLRNWTMDIAMENIVNAISSIYLEVAHDISIIHNPRNEESSL